MSDFANIICGVPQGSVLEPLTLSLREAAHSGSGVLAMGWEATQSDSPIYPGQFIIIIQIKT